MRGVLTPKKLKALWQYFKDDPSRGEQSLCDVEYEALIEGRAELSDEILDELVETTHVDRRWLLDDFDRQKGPVFCFYIGGGLFSSPYSSLQPLFYTIQNLVKQQKGDWITS